MDIEKEKFISLNLFGEAAELTLDSFLNIRKRYREVCTREKLTAEEQELLWELMKIVLYGQVRLAYLHMDD